MLSIDVLSVAEVVGTESSCRRMLNPPPADAVRLSLSFASSMAKLGSTNMSIAGIVSSLGAARLVPLEEEWVDVSRSFQVVVLAAIN